MAESSYQEHRRQLGGFQCASAAAVSQSVQAALLPYQTSVCVSNPTALMENLLAYIYLGTHMVTLVA